MPSPEFQFDSHLNGQRNLQKARTMDHNAPSPLSSSEQEDNPPPAVRQTFNTISTSAKIAQDVLRSAGLDWLLASNETTPQKFISDLAGHIPGNYLVG